MEYAYDFHIHTAASPCADELMSPHNIVNMAKLNDLRVIAITDHNTCANCEVLMNVGKAQGLIVIPGMEIECIEEFHSIALFPTIDAAKRVEKHIQEYLPPIKNKTHIFGDQLIFDEDDQVIGQIEQLLITAVQLPATMIYKIVREEGGVIYPAHIERNAYSILSNLGSIPEELNVHVAEMSLNVKKEDHLHLFPKGKVMRSSDAHYLEQICCEHDSLEIEECSVKNVIEHLKISF